MREEEKPTHMNIRFPSDVVLALRTFAQEDARSFHGMVIWILREYIKQRQAKS